MTWVRATFGSKAVKSELLSVDPYNACRGDTTESLQIRENCEVLRGMTIEEGQKTLPSECFRMNDDPATA